MLRRRIVQRKTPTFEPGPENSGPRLLQSTASRSGIKPGRRSTYQAVEPVQTNRATSDFTGAYVFQTRLEGVDLSAAVGLEQGQIDIACGDGATRLPAGLSSPAAWPCAVE